MVSAYSIKYLSDGTKAYKEYYKCGHNKSSIQDRCTHRTFYDGDALEFYVRKNKGLQRKRDDSRTVDIEHVNRKPDESHYKAIVEAMEHFNMI